jgi:hypothetical protein
MKRRINVDAGSIRIAATINTNGRQLTRDEVENIRDDLADELQTAVTRVRYIGIPRNRVKVK